MSFIRTTMMRAALFWDAVDKFASPFFFLGLRLWVGLIFFRSGLQKLQDWEGTLYLFQHEYMVPLLPFSWAALSATFFELVAAPMVMIGLLTRLAALPLLAMTTLIQLTYLQHDHHWAWGAVFLLLILKGPGTLSCDTLVVCALRRK